MQDSEIVGLFNNRDERAISEAKSKYGGYCLSVAGNILGDPCDAEECLSDALLAAWNSIPPGSPGNLRTYLGKISRRLAISRLRERTAKKRVPPEAIVALEELGEISSGDSAGEGGAGLSELLSAFLRSQREDDRNIFIRRYWYFDPVSEISARYGFTKSKVTVSLKRTRDRLRDYLRKEGVEI
jgi:RNA polymerase sigma-70 factor (ECF subfamily)